jgi:hypothetical protein
MSLAPGIFGGLVAAALVAWLTTRAKSAARYRNGRFVVEYSLPAKIAASFSLIVGLLILYAATRASADQKILAACVAGTLFVGVLAVFLEFFFARVEFDEDSIYTFSPWRRHRVIPWRDVVGYSFSSVNKWHVLKTREHRSIRLSVMMCGLGDTRQQYKKQVDHEMRSDTPPTQKWL